MDGGMLFERGSSTLMTTNLPFFFTLDSGTPPSTRGGRKDTPTAAALTATSGAATEFVVGGTGAGIITAPTTAGVPLLFSVRLMIS